MKRVGEQNHTSTTFFHPKFERQKPVLGPGRGRGLFDRPLFAFFLFGGREEGEGEEEREGSKRTKKLS